MKRKFMGITAFVLALMILMTGCSDGKKDDAPTDGSVPDVTDEMQNAAFWTAKYKDAQNVIMDSAAIDKLNKTITADSSSGVVDLVAYPSQITAAQVKAYLSAFSMPNKELFDREGIVYSQEFLDTIIASVNLDGILESNKVSYALTLANTDLKKFPTISRGFTSMDDLGNDSFQQGRLSIGEPVVVLHTNLEQDWYFVQSYNDRGWVEMDKLVFMEKGSWVNYINSENFLIVTGDNVVLDRDPYAADTTVLTLSMGTKLPLYEDAIIGNTISGQGIASSYIVKIPSKDRFGQLEFIPLAIPKSSDVSIGYLPYTSENVIKQSFKLLGRRYGYNNLYGNRDNDEFVSDIYKTFGIIMPNTIDKQSKIAASDIDLKSLTAEERAKKIAELTPGTLMFTDENAFIYLGQHDDKPFIIYPATTFYFNSQMYTANTVLVTGMSVVRRDGTAFADAVNTAKLLEVVKNSEEKTEEK